MAPADNHGKIRELLTASEIFREFTPEELMEIIKISTITSYQKNEKVYSESQEANYLFLVAEGQFRQVFSKINEIEYSRGDLFGEIGIINNSLRPGTVTAIEAAEAVTICGVSLFKHEYIKPELTLKIVRAIARKLTHYLTSDRQQLSTRNLILHGEDEHVEFKSTLRHNLKLGKKDNAVQFASLKTIAAFLNSEGGTLLIGIGDDGEIVGIKQDAFENHDKYLLHLTNLIKSKIGTLFMQFVDLHIVPMEDKFIVRIDCLPANEPAYLTKEGKEHFFIRTGPATTSLSISQTVEYIQGHFKQFSSR